MTEFKNLFSIDILTNQAEPVKITFLRALVCIAKLDKHFDQEEERYITALANTLKIRDYKSVLEQTDPQEVLQQISKFTDRRVATELIKQLCLIGHADSNLSDEEILFIGHAGQAMNLSLEKIEQISDWVVDSMLLAERGKLIFED